MPGQQLMRIGELAEAAGLSVRTLRYYEERGLLEPVARTEGNYRLYDQRALATLRTIRRLKMLGMSLDNIAGLKELHDREGTCTGALRERFLQITADRVRQIDRWIEELTVLREELDSQHRRLAALVAASREENLNRLCRDFLGSGKNGVEKTAADPPPHHRRSTRAAGHGRVTNT